MFKLVVLSSVLAIVAAKPGALAPLGLAGHGLIAPWAHLASPLIAPVASLGHLAVAPALAAYNYRGPVSLAPGQPASILAADGRPFDTLNVNLDRAAHLTARAIDHAAPHLGHYLKKRSAPLLAAPALTHGLLGAHAPLLAPAPLALPAAHLGWPAAALWGAHGAHWGHHW